MPTRQPEGTAALEKALDVLDAIGSAGHGLTQAALSEALGLPRTTLYRLLGSLTARGLLRRDPVRRVYCLGSRCFEYARTAWSMPDLIAASSAELRVLRDMTGETTCLAALDGREAVSLEHCDGAHGLRSVSAVGERTPLHCSGQGKAILSALPPEQRDALVRGLVLAATTPRTITDRRRLQAELRQVAARGWSIDDEELASGVRACGAPIVDADGAVRGAISVSGPAFRLSIERLALIGPEVAEAARRIGAHLSAAQPSQAGGVARAVPGDSAFDGAFPCWSSADGALWWADTRSPSVHRARTGGDAVVLRLDAPIAALLPDPEGGARVRTGGRWVHVAADGGARPLSDMPSRPPSASCCAPDGSVWASVPDGAHWRIGALGGAVQGGAGWRLSEPASALAWDATGRQLTIATADSGTLWVATPGSQALRRLATVPRGAGRLGGVAVDAAGGTWCALRGGWSVVRLDADGAVDRVVALPVPCPTDLGFGGESGDILFVTTTRDTVSRDALEAAPLSGRLFAIDGVADRTAAPRAAR